MRIATVAGVDRKSNLTPWPRSGKNIEICIVIHPNPAKTVRISLENATLPCCKVFQEYIHARAVMCVSKWKKCNVLWGYWTIKQNHHPKPMPACPSRSARMSWYVRKSGSSRGFRTHNCPEVGDVVSAFWSLRASKSNKQRRKIAQTASGSKRRSEIPLSRR